MTKKEVREFNAGARAFALDEAIMYLGRAAGILLRCGPRSLDNGPGVKDATRAYDLVVQATKFARTGKLRAER